MCMRANHQSELSQKTTDSEHWSIGASPVHADQDRSNAVKFASISPFT